ncbi:chorismate mutase [Micromonospora sp. IBSANI012]|uniref:chorismate mutase n=1 Tax=Micromonospora sp. IBSANI012 TaxID=3457761 RepID=UPI0040597F17
MSDQHPVVAPAGSTPAGAAEGPTRIAALRARIDGLDQRIVELLAERTRVVRELTVHKTDEAAVRSPDRVRQVLDRVHDLAERHGMPPAVAVGTYRALIEELTRMQLEMMDARRAEPAAGER